jgi:hypothetical protein
MGDLAMLELEVQRLRPEAPWLMSRRSMTTTRAPALAR